MICYVFLNSCFPYSRSLNRLAESLVCTSEIFTRAFRHAHSLPLATSRYAIIKRLSSNCSSPKGRLRQHDLFAWWVSAQKIASFCPTSTRVWSAVRESATTLGRERKNQTHTHNDDSKNNLTCDSDVIGQSSRKLVLYRYNRITFWPGSKMPRQNQSTDWRRLMVKILRRIAPNSVPKNSNTEKWYATRAAASETFRKCNGRKQTSKQSDEKRRLKNIINRKGDSKRRVCEIIIGMRTHVRDRYTMKHSAKFSPDMLESPAAWKNTRVTT